MTRSLTLALLTASLACTDSTGPRAASATVEVLAAEIPYQSFTHAEETRIEFEVPVRIHNNDTVPIGYHRCGYSIDSAEQQGWKMAWYPNCNLLQVPRTLIPPGHYRETTFRVSAHIAGNGVPKWEARGMGGLLRLRVHLAREAGGGEMSVSSEGFLLRKVSASPE